jgi:hypothetical protein
MTVRQVRSVASDVNDGQSVARTLETEGITLGELTVELDPIVYRELRRRAAIDGDSPGDVVSELLDGRLE